MPHSLINPAGLHDPVDFGYSHVGDAGELVFISGQYGSDTAGHVASDDFGVQVQQSLTNLATALAAAGLDFSHVVKIGTFIVDHDPDKLATLVEQLGEIWGNKPPAQTLLGVASLALPGVLFEIDAVAARP